MSKEKRPDPKAEALRQQGALNPKAEEVTDPLFQEDPFYDPRDLVQVKYEMVRRVRSGDRSVTAATRAFGFSRPMFYRARSILNREGLPGLTPKKRGPRSGHKVTPEILNFIEQERKKNPSIRTRELLALVQERFGVTVHRRTMERALDRLKKKRH